MSMKVRTENAIKEVAIVVAMLAVAGVVVADCADSLGVAEPRLYKSQSRAVACTAFEDALDAKTQAEAVELFDHAALNAIEAGETTLGGRLTALSVAARQGAYDVQSAAVVTEFCRR